MQRPAFLLRQSDTHNPGMAEAGSRRSSDQFPHKGSEDQALLKVELGVDPHLDQPLLRRGSRRRRVVGLGFQPQIEAEGEGEGRPRGPHLQPGLPRWNSGVRDVVLVWGGQRTRTRSVLQDVLRAGIQNGEI